MIYKDIRESIFHAPILIVDDMQENVDLIASILKQNGYLNLYVETDPRKVTDIILEIEFELIILDIRMPHISGTSLLEDMRRIYSDSYSPVLVLSAETDPATKIEALSLGAQDYLDKPFDYQELVHRVNNLVFTRRLYNSYRMTQEVMEIKVRERTRHLNDSRREIIYRLGRMAEFRDNETGDHVVRVSKVSGILARKMGINERDAELIELVAPMHDVGKVGIPDSVLLKDGKLSPTEYEIMKTHTTIGYEILSEHPSDMVQLAAIVARHHHEQWDGKGYPDGLAGKDIPIECRIISVADVFDALTSRRPYKEPWPMEEACAKILELSGSAFDPDVVAAFESSIDQIIEIVQIYNE